MSTNEISEEIERLFEPDALQNAGLIPNAYAPDTWPGVDLDMPRIGDTEEGKPYRFFPQVVVVDGQDEVNGQIGILYLPGSEQMLVALRREKETGGFPVTADVSIVWSTVLAEVENEAKQKFGPITDEQFIPGKGRITGSKRLNGIVPRPPQKELVLDTKLDPPWDLKMAYYVTWPDPASLAAAIAGKTLVRKDELKEFQQDQIEKAMLAEREKQMAEVWSWLVDDKDPQASREIITAGDGRRFIFLPKTDLFGFGKDLLAIAGVCKDKPTMKVFTQIPALIGSQDKDPKREGLTITEFNDMLRQQFGFGIEDNRLEIICNHQSGTPSWMGLITLKNAEEFIEIMMESDLEVVEGDN